MNDQTRRHADSEQKWNLRVLQGEANLLRREKDHLIQKGAERTLTVWEQSRLNEIFDELDQILSELTTLASKSVKAA